MRPSPRFEALLIVALLAACNRSQPPQPAEVFIPAGEFITGCGDAANPRHPLHVPAFYIDRRLVIEGEHKACVAAGACTEPPPQPTADKAIAARTQDEAARYCQWAGKRLPTSMEWEKAARGTDGRFFVWGDDPNHRCAEKRCQVRSPYGVESVMAVRQWVDHRSHPTFARGMAVGWGIVPCARENTHPANDGHPGSFTVAAFRCARSADQ